MRNSLKKTEYQFVYRIAIKADAKFLHCHPLNFALKLSQMTDCLAHDKAQFMFDVRIQRFSSLHILRTKFTIFFLVGDNLCI